MTYYSVYLLGWQACLAGVDGRYRLSMPEDIRENATLRRCWRLGWEDAFNREDNDDVPPPESQLDLS